jgi:hypothetical protein
MLVDPASAHSTISLSPCPLTLSWLYLLEKCPKLEYPYTISITWLIIFTKVARVRSLAALNDDMGSVLYPPQVTSLALLTLLKT